MHVKLEPFNGDPALVYGQAEKAFEYYSDAFLHTK